jgi:hypothetical protein
LEELRDETHVDEKKSAQLKKAALAKLFAE